MMLLLVFFVFWIAAGGELGTYAAFATTKSGGTSAAPNPAQLGNYGSTGSASLTGSPSTFLNSIWGGVKGLSTDPLFNLQQSPSFGLN